MEEHLMLECIRLCCCLAARLLSLRMGFFKRVSTILSTCFMAGLENKKCLSKIKILGALLNPLYQSKSCMIEGGLCTEDQYMAGKVELLDRLSHFYEGQEQEVTSAVRHESTNEWDDIKLLDCTKVNKTLKMYIIFIVFTSKAHIFQGWCHQSCLGLILHKEILKRNLFILLMPLLRKERGRIYHEDSIMLNMLTKQVIVI
ncbi:hypothetical protein ACHAW6_007325 [Cyclotella cf. meneghiniana]